MRKLVVLMLVLGMASLASADFVTGLQVSPAQVTAWGDTLLVSVTATFGPTDAPATVWLGIEGTGDGVFSNAALGSAAGTGAVLSDGGYGAAYLTTSYPAPATPGSWSNGNIFTVTLKANGPGTVLNLYGADGTTLVASKEVTLTPEPATLAILGLGGLLLRRKK
jgi:hypothetical protein